MGESIYDLLGPGGYLSQVRASYEHRPQQIRLAQAVADILAHGGVMLAEAGTGTGKTLAYLAAVLETQRRVVISTGTKNLQDQLLAQDIPLLERSLRRSLSAVMLKGVSNYLCRRKFDLLRRTVPLMESSQAEVVLAIDEWARGSETGDRAECTAIAEDDPIWLEVCSDSSTRLGSRCPFNDNCFVNRARLAAQDAQIVVVNHHLFFADLAIRQGSGGILPSYDAVIFDEAHQIEGIATDFFGFRVSSGQVEELCRDCRRLLPTLPELDGQAVASAEGLLQGAVGSAEAFFALLGRGQVAPGRYPLDREEITGPLEQAYWRFDAALEGLAAWVGAQPSTDEGLKGCGRRAEALRQDMSEILAQGQRASVYWKEVGPRSAAVGASPIDVAGRLRESVFWNVEAAVLTSATLAVDGSFRYVQDRLGLDFEVTELVLPSPFDFDRQAALFLPAHAPDPRNSGYHEAFAALVTQTFECVPGGALVLFTSYRDMARVAALLRRRASWPLRVQGERPRAALMAELREAREPMMLLATASFWEGVDIPGEALQLVVIARLPFASPVDPLVAARLQQLQEQGRNGFMEYQVPQACLALKQGFGRLIRSQRDRGVVAVFDGRIQRMGYGKVFLRTLPSCPVTTNLEELTRWWQNAGQSWGDSSFDYL
jgi:ATP-dependent DNA helicase DinG